MLSLPFPIPMNWRKTLCKENERGLRRRNSFCSLLACGLEPKDNSVLFLQSDVVFAFSSYVESLPLRIGLDSGEQYQHQSSFANASIQRQNCKAWQQGWRLCESARSSLLSRLNDRGYHDVQCNTYDSFRSTKQMYPWGKTRFSTWRWLAISSITSIGNTTFTSTFPSPKCLWVELELGCEVGRRIMSLSDGKKKMSKSSQTQYSNISIIGLLWGEDARRRLSRANPGVHQASQDGLFAGIIVLNACWIWRFLDWTKSSDPRFTICSPSWLRPPISRWKPCMSSTK